MSEFTTIEQKLRLFSRKYYTNELIRGIILFTTFGLLYFFLTVLIEYFLWLKPNARTILFWLFVAIETFLLIRFIGFPIFKLIGLQKGISKEEISVIIGNHFPKVNDKLLNLLQLSKSNEQSDLLIASINQKTKELQPIKFTKAINFNSNLKYLKYAIIPFVIWGISLISGKNNDLNSSFKRVVNHNTAYLPPAPFNINLTNTDLNVIQGESLTIYAEAKGNKIPEQAKIYFKNEEYFLNNEGNGLFSYTFNKITNPVNFYIKANKVSSIDYAINIIKTPTIEEISMQLFYPKYLNRKSEIIKNTGNTTLPEGTTVQWKIKTHQTDSVTFINNYKKNYFTKNKDNNFTYSKRIKNNTNYQIATANSKLSDYEKLQFNINVVKDEYPMISVKSNIDSITRGTALFAGQISDDYGFKKLQVTYYDIKNPNEKKYKNIEITENNVQSFFYEFPKNLKLEEGINYELFFEVFDNDAMNSYKKSTSKTFSYYQKTENEEEEELLKEQKNYLEDLEHSIEKQERNKKELEKLQFDLQNKKNINWNDQKKIQNIIKRQEQYKQMMQKQTKRLQENFSEKKEKNKNLQRKKEELQKRIEEIKDIKKQQKLLDELMKMADKLNKEELIKKTKELAEQNKQQERSLERILEMTKQYYVEQKMSQLSDKLKELAKKQEDLSKKDSSKEEQKALNKEFNKLKNELNDLNKDNQKLKKPLKIPSLEELKRDTDQKLDGAKKDLEQNNKSSAKEKQKKASENLKEMSSKMQQSMQNMNMEMQEENQENLRYILENLLTFSFDQEAIMERFSKINSSHPDFGKSLKKQHQLKTYFEHIDDSLFAISIRIPKISADIDEKLATAHYNLNQSLENLAESHFSNGIKNQHYVMTAANELADMLSNTLDAMKNKKQGSGKGKGKKQSFSLPDIIKKQGELLSKMQNGIKQKDNKGKPKPGDSKNSKPGDSGKPKNGKNGKPKEGKNGNSKEGENNKNGNGSNEEKLNGELYKIYKEQSELRQQLEEAIKQGGGNKSGKAKEAVKKMEQLENQILEKGFNQSTFNQMQKLNYQLLKLDKATFKQGKDNKRKSTTNYKTYSKNRDKAIEFKNKYINQTEILNRLSLPLKDNYKKKVQEYFNNNDTN